MEFSLPFKSSNKNPVRLFGTLYADIVHEKHLLDGILKRNRRHSRNRNFLPSYDDATANNNTRLATATGPTGSTAVRSPPYSNHDKKTRTHQKSNTLVGNEFIRSLKYFDEDNSHLANLVQSLGLHSLDDLAVAADTSIPTTNSIQEPPPPYTCTVYKMGNVRMKHEFFAGGSALKDRSWRKRYVKLWGTLLYFYNCERDAKNPSRHPPLRTLSMQRVVAGLAPEYSRKLKVLRIRMPGGEQLLLELGTPKEMISWIEHLQAAANISMDLDHRKMPKFVTMVRPNNNRFGRTFNVDLGAHQRTVVAVCNSRSL